MYISKYFTNEEIDQRLLEGYYDDFVKAGFEGSKEEFFAFVLSIKQCVMKEEGKGLSTNDFSDEYKQKLESMEWTTRYLENLEFVVDEPITVEHAVLTFVQNPINQPSGQEEYNVQFNMPQDGLVVGSIYESIYILKPTYDTRIDVTKILNIQQSGQKDLVGGKWNHVKFTWAVTAYEEGTATGYINIEVQTDPGSKSESVWSTGTGAHSALLPESGSKASGEHSVAEGKETIASGNNSHAEGRGTQATGNNSHAEGYLTVASGGSHAEGYQSNAVNYYSHAEGYLTQTGGYGSHAEGCKSETGGTATSNTKTPGTTSEVGAYAHAEGNATIAKGLASHSEGKLTFASGEAAHAEGQQTEATGSCSHAEGKETVASGDSSHSEGSNTKAKGNFSHAEGSGSQTTNTYAHAEGNTTIARGSASHTEGFTSETGGTATSNTKASGTITTAGTYAHAEGNATIAKGVASHSEGKLTFASGEAAHAEGVGTEAKNEGEHAEGLYNRSTVGKTIHSVGIGTRSKRMNASEITKDGSMFIYGVGGYDGVILDESTESVQDIILVETLSNEEINNLIPELV